MKKYIDADRLREEIKIIQKSLEQRDVRFNQIKQIRTNCMIEFCKMLNNVIDSLQQEQPEEEFDKLVNEEFASHSRTTEYGLEATYNRAELYQLIKRIALVFNARKL